MLNIFIEKLDDDKIIEMAKEYCKASPKKELASNLLAQKYVQVNRMDGLVNVHALGGDMLRVVDVWLTDHSVRMITREIEDCESATKAHLKNMLREFGIELFSILNTGIRTGEIKDIDLQTLYTIYQEVERENQETPNM